MFYLHVYGIVFLFSFVIRMQGVTGLTFSILYPLYLAYDNEIYFFCYVKPNFAKLNEKSAFLLQVVGDRQTREIVGLRG